MMNMLNNTSGRIVTDASKKIEDFVFAKWDESIVDSLKEYIEIPNASPLFDSSYLTNGYQEKAARHIADWVEKQPIKDLKLELIQDKDKTPLIFIEIPAFGNGTNDSTILSYAHFDKQPPLTEGWNEGLGPYKPVMTPDGKLYGRGGADDGYGTYCAMTAIAALQNEGKDHNRIVMLVEGCEESGSKDLPGYIEKLRPRIGVPELVLCLDSGCGNYEQLWMTSSLRGAVVGTLRVDILTEGIHSGNSGIASSSFRILRRTLDRLEDPDTGNIIPPVFNQEIPPHRIEEAKQAALALGNAVFTELPLLDNARPMHDDVAQLLLNKAWRAMLSVTGVEGMPALVDAGNVLRAYTAVKLSLRLPPDVDAPAAAQALKETLEKDPMYNAKVSFSADKFASGWQAPKTAEWLDKSLKSASMNYFGKPAQFIGEGGSIPLMGMLGKMFPESQFVVTGVLGPKSNAHGPNEFLHVPFAKRITCCIADVVAAHAAK